MTTRKILAFFLSIAMLLSLLGQGVFAANAGACNRLSATDSKSQIEPVLTEANVRSAVNSYFSQRSAFLRGNTDTIDVAVPAITRDEADHAAKMELKEIDFVNSLLTDLEISCWGHYATVTVTERATYYVDGQNVQKSIAHEMRVFMHDDGRLEIASDGYSVPLYAFSSASYVNSEEISVNASTAGSSSCIITVAKGEVGYTDPGINQTKYNDYFGFSGAWCAMFVSWCANRANVSTVTIPHASTCAALRTFYLNSGKYYSSSSQGGSYTPKIGDLFFQYNNASTPGHVGFVSSVSSSSITVIDGNCENKVNQHTISLTDTSLVAFASVSYVSSGHTAGSTWSSNASAHWKYCTNCSSVCSYASHTFLLVQTGGPYKCKVCGYITYAVVNGHEHDEDCCTCHQ